MMTQYMNHLSYAYGRITVKIKTMEILQYFITFSIFILLPGSPNYFMPNVKIKREIGSWIDE